MDWVRNLFLGDPVLDENNQIVERNFGIKNAIAIGVALYMLHLLASNTCFKRGKGKKMKGGDMDDNPSFFLYLALLGLCVSVCIMSSGDEEKVTFFAFLFLSIGCVIFGYFFRHSIFGLNAPTRQRRVAGSRPPPTQRMTTDLTKPIAPMASPESVLRHST